ncbi:MAG: tetratricopeptide repeat protein [Myxococcota bacterium]
MTHDRVLIRVGWVVIVALVALAYFNGLQAPFVYDDRIEVVGNATIHNLDELRAVLEYNVSRFLLILSYAWNYQVWGTDPLGYHLTSLVIHGLTIGAALNMAVRVGKLGTHPQPVWTAVLAVGVWGIHPMGTEAVTYITGRSESLCALFVCLSLACWAGALLKEREQEGAAKGLRLLTYVVALLSMGTKEVAGMTPFALFALEWFFRSEKRPLRWAWYVPFFAIIALGVTGRALYAEHFIPREVDRPLLVQLTTQAEVWLRYIALWAVPRGQTLYHHVPDVLPWTLRGATVIVVFCAVIAGLYRLVRSNPMVSWALICGALFLVPSSSVVALKESMAEHRSYQLGLYLSLALAWSVPMVWMRRAAWSMTVVIPVLLALTIGRNNVWSSEVSLWEEATTLHPEVAEGWYALGDAHRFLGDHEQAAHEYRNAIKRDPKHLDSWNNLGISLAEMGDESGAKQAWKSALKVRRTYCKAHANLGFLALESNEIDEAIIELHTTLSYCPTNRVAHYGLGLIYAEQRRDPKQAVAHFEELLRLDPSFSRAEEVRQKLLELTW